MTGKHQFTGIRFSRFKAFKTFSLKLRHFNILVGPNNAGKSTIIAAFRILEAALRKANSRKPEIVTGPSGIQHGYKIDLTEISIADENIFHNYDDSAPATVEFDISNGNKLLLYFPEARVCHFIPISNGRAISSPSAFEKQFDCSVGFVPILGPVDHQERLYEKEAARKALFNYGAARNFRNIWYHYPEKFQVFREALKQTWPGMDVEPPKVEHDYSTSRHTLSMFCPEERIPREIFWAGFGFQVWCQLLTHIVQSSHKSMFLIDEPDIYLHSDLQRQLLALLRNLGPDILIATHSTEIVSEAEADDIVLIDKKKSKAKRIKNPSQLAEVFSILGSNLNPILTQLAKTRRAVFVEGKDFQILGKFANKLESHIVSSRSNFAVVPVDGFSPERIRSLINGMVTTLGSSVLAAVILDRDFRCLEEINDIKLKCEDFSHFVHVHNRKEIENFLLAPTAIDRAAARRVADQVKRSGKAREYSGNALQDLLTYAENTKSDFMAQAVENRQRYIKSIGQKDHDKTIMKKAIGEFEDQWKDQDSKLRIIAGKDALSWINQSLQTSYGVSVTPTAIIDALLPNEIPLEMIELIASLAAFSKKEVN